MKLSTFVLILLSIINGIIVYEDHDAWFNGIACGFMLGTLIEGFLLSSYLKALNKDNK